MQNDKLATILRDIGLSEDEANVYLSSLSLGPTSVLKISRATDLKRTTIYGIIEALKEKGLMRIEVRGLKQFYTAESPEKLDVMLKRKKKEFESRLPEFMSLYSMKGGESSFKYYHGIEAMKRIYLETLREIKPHEEYLVVANQDKWFNLAPDFWMKEYIEKRAKLNIQTRLLFQDSPTAREHKKFERNFNQAIRLLPEGTSLNVDMLLLPHKLIVIDLASPLTTLVIENTSMIELHKNMFKLIWDSIKQ